MYKVIRKFADLEDGNHIYHEGDAYPRKGKSPSEKRIAFLASSNNLLKTPVIKRISAKTEKKQDVIPETATVQDVQETKPKRGRKPKAKKTTEG